MKATMQGNTKLKLVKLKYQIHASHLSTYIASDPTKFPTNHGALLFSKLKAVNSAFVRHPLLFDKEHEVNQNLPADLHLRHKNK